MIPASIYFANKTARTYQVLAHSQSLGAPEIANLRGWMTVTYVADTFGVPRTEILVALGLPEDTDAALSLRELAVRSGAEAVVFIQRVQVIIAERLNREAPATTPATDGWFDRVTEQSLTAFLVYGYPALVIVLFLGALGLPLPAGPIATVAGSVAALGEIDLTTAAALAVTASVCGDLAGYAIGRFISPATLTKYGRWVGYTPKNRTRLQRLYDRWGGLTLILTRSLVAYVGAVASLLAGTGRYPVQRFLIYSVAGRLIWTASYIGLGYFIGNDFAAASGFLGYLSMLLIAAGLFASSLYLLVQRLRNTASSAPTT